MRLTVFVHGGLKAFFEPAGATLVAMGFVDRTASFLVALCLACVHTIPMYTALEETGAPCDNGETATAVLNFATIMLFSE